MAITFVNEAHANGSGGTVTVNVPAGVANGDVMVAFIHASDVSATTPTGWTSLITTQPRSGEDFALYYRVAASEPASYTWTWGAGSFVGSIVAWRGVSVGTPIDVTAAAGTAVTSGTTVVAPTRTTVTNNALLITATAIHPNTTFTPAGSMTERADTNNGTALTLTVDEELIPTAGATGTRTATAGATITFGRAVAFALRPAANTPVSANVTATGTVAVTKVKTLSVSASIIATAAVTMVKNARPVRQVTATGTVTRTLNAQRTIPTITATGTVTATKALTRLVAAAITVMSTVSRTLRALRAVAVTVTGSVTLSPVPPVRLRLSVAAAPQGTLYLSTSAAQGGMVLSISPAPAGTIRLSVG